MKIDKVLALIGTSDHKIGLSILRQLAEYIFEQSSNHGESVIVHENTTVDDNFVPMEVNDSEGDKCLESMQIDEYDFEYFSDNSIDLVDNEEIVDVISVSVDDEDSCHDQNIAYE